MFLRLFSVRARVGLGSPASFVRLLLVCGCLAWLPRLGAAPSRYDLPAQPLPASLMAVSRQAGVQVLFSHSELKHLQAPAVAGEFEAAAVLARLLEGSGYEAVAQGAKQFLVRRATAGVVRGTLLQPDERPAEGVRVTAGFEFDVPVRFDTDTIQVSVQSFRAGDLPQVPVVEVRI